MNNCTIHIADNNLSPAAKMQLGLNCFTDT